MHYKTMVQGFALNDFGGTATATEEKKDAVKSKKKKVVRPKTALPRELAYKKALLRKMGKEEEPIGVNTVKAETKTGMKGVLSSSAPRRKQEILIPKQKRVQRRLRPSLAEDSEDFGTKIAHFKLA